MTIKPAVRISERKLVVKERTILSDVPENLVATSGAAAGSAEGVFLGPVFDQDGNRHVVSSGGCTAGLTWAEARIMGEKGRDIPLETQFLLVETKDGSHLEPDTDGDGENKIVYTVFLPLVEGPFKACLQGGRGDDLQLCLESGDSAAVGSAFTHSVYVSSGTDPYKTVHEAMKAVKLHLGTFKLRNEKKLPGIVDYFGWCTWDAFYQEVSHEGVEAGLESLKAGGAPPKFVIIDDGWQSVGSDEAEKPGLLRLTGIRENSKFQRNDPGVGIKSIVEIAKEKHGLKYVYVWHAIIGYWGGVRPGVSEYESVIQYPKLGKGPVGNEPGLEKEAAVLEGVGVVNPKNVYKFYNELHSYLSSAGVDGVKVDGQCILETVGGGLGGRVELTKQYHQALDASVARNFPDNGCIACMSHNLESLYCSKQTAIVRASDDFYPKDLTSHTIHVAAVSYNSLFLGEIMLPDWDMFHSLHPAAEYHGSARAISGGPVYVSDAPGKHDFYLLRKLVLPDGSILRALFPGRPTKDCLFSDPTRDGCSLLKIWNMNNYTGVLGIYNCQGAAWNSIEKKNTFHQTDSEAITGYIRGRDVHLISDAAFDPNWDGTVALYANRSGILTTLPYNVAMPVSLKVLEHEIYTITPVKALALGILFAPLGLIDMFNAGGAIAGLKYDLQALPEPSVTVEVKGCGRFGCYSSVRPKKCSVGSSAVRFEYDTASGLVALDLVEIPVGDHKVHNVEIKF